MAVILVLVLCAASAPTSLYGVYQRLFGFPTFTLTAIYGVFAIAGLATLLKPWRAPGALRALDPWSTLTVRAHGFARSEDMLTSRSTSRLGAALIGAVVTLALTAGFTLAHPESEGEHGGCVVTAEPGTIGVAGQFTVEGNFGGASIWVLPGSDAAVPEGAAPAATTPAGESSFSVTFTATGDPGELTIFAAIEGSECGDTDHVTVTATLPNTAMNDQAVGLAAIVGLLLLAGAFLAPRLNRIRAGVG